MSEIIKCNGLSKTYQNKERSVQAVRDFTYTFEEGKSYAIIGPSGCGKSTMLNMIGLLLKPTMGEISILSRNAADLNEREKAQMRNKTFGYIAQDYLLDMDSTIESNIKIPLYYRKEKMPEKDKKIAEVLSAVDLDGLQKEKCSRLSGGQMQRVAIARALVNDPEILLADEPTGALDSENSEKVFSLLLEQVKKGKTLILVTHNTSLAERCDHIIPMLDGRILKP